MKNQTKTTIRQLKRQRTAALVANNMELANDLLNKIQQLKQSLIVKQVQANPKPINNEVKKVKEEGKVTPKIKPELYVKYHDQGKSDKEIAKLTGKTIEQLYAMKSYWKKNNKLPERFLNKTVSTPKQQVTASSTTNTPAPTTELETKNLKKHLLALKC